MRSIKILLSAVLTLSVSAFAFAAPAVDSPGSSTNFSVSTPTEIPGTTLKSGQYSIRIVDRLTDRMIVRVDSASAKVHSTFIGLLTNNLQSANTGAIAFDTAPEGHAALRGFKFSAGTVVEFVYPKAQAVSLAKLNSSKVIAIDPASEGRVDAPSLSKSDMELVTLWALSPEAVGGDAPSIKAERYQQASLVKPSKPRINRLPQTASQLPVLWGCAFGFSILAAGLALRRKISA